MSTLLLKDDRDYFTHPISQNHRMSITQINQKKKSTSKVDPIFIKRIEEILWLKNSLKLLLKDEQKCYITHQQKASRLTGF